MSLERLSLEFFALESAVFMFEVIEDFNVSSILNEEKLFKIKSQNKSRLFSGI